MEVDVAVYPDLQETPVQLATQVPLDTLYPYAHAVHLTPAAELEHVAQFLILDEQVGQEPFE